jgi:hypothetical protein
MPDALAGRGDFERRVDGGIAGAGMIAAEGVNSLGVTAYRDNIGLADRAGVIRGDRGGDECFFRLVLGMRGAPPVAMRCLPFGDAMGSGSPNRDDGYTR